MTASRVGAAALLVALVAAVALAARGPDPGATPTPHAVEARVMSSWCPGLTLAECPSAQAGDLRREIAGKVAAGWTNERIDAWLVANYGEGILGRPRGMAAFLVPAAAILAGGVVVALVLRRRRPRGADPTPAEPVPPPQEPGAGTVYRERLDEELRRFAGEATE
ncbi:MAG: cytochrome c-type biogenesis protein [Actinomycetota bacterium]